MNHNNQNQFIMRLTKISKTLIFLLLLALCCGPVSTQDKPVDYYLNIDPSTILSKNMEKQLYNVSLKWQNLDALNGDSFNCNVVYAVHSVDGSRNEASWDDVRMAQISDFNDKPQNTVNLSALDGFSYGINNLDFLGESFYNELPSDLIDLARWLVSDAIQMQGMVWYFIDSLEFNRELSPVMLEDYDIVFENWVKFTSRYQKLKWSAITKHNEEICAVINFQSAYNPVQAKTDDISFKGRSLYYGEIWVSLQDKQVEDALMLEDVVMNLEGSMFPQKQLIDLQREIVFDRIK